ncbi:integrase, catalytic region, zinc finger, CCHC-type containing protein [Tanacetum coccineum]
MGDRFLPNNSQGKKQEVEDHRRNFKFSYNKTSVTVCNDSLNVKPSNVNFVYVTCGKCVLNDNHDMCVLHYINGVNSRTRQPIDVPISTREPKQTMNQSVATSYKKTVATDSTVKKPRNIIRKIYEQVRNETRNANISEHITPRCFTLSNTPLSSNSFAARTVKFRNDQITPILGYGDLVQGTITIKRVYYVKGLNHNLFSVGQFCDADLEVAFQKSTCYIRDLKGNDLLTGSRGTDLYSITLQDITSPNPICLMAKATSTQAWLWHRIEFLNKTLHAYFAKEGIRHETSTAQTPKQNGVVERRNRTLVEAARTMLRAAKVLLFFWAEAITTTCFTQNRSLVIPRHEKTPYHIINAQKPSVKFFHIFGSLCYIVRDGENLNKIKEKDTPPLNIHSTPETSSQTPTQAPTVNATENIIQAETNKDNAQVEEDKFINIFSTPVQEQEETSSRHVDSSNMHTLYQHHPSAQCWTRDHPLEQVIGNPSQSVRTRR